MHVFDLSDCNHLVGNPYVFAATPILSCGRFSYIDFIPNGPSFDLKVSLGFFI